MLHETRFRAAGRFVVSPLLAVAAVAIFLVPGAAELFTFQRSGVFAGEFWRIFTGHLTHFTGTHLFWDVGALLVLGWLAERRSVVRFAATLVGSAVLISLGVLVLLPQMPEYRGLSGVDSALFGLVAVTLLREQLQRRARLLVMAIAVVLLGFGGKIAFELITGTAFFARDLEPGVMPVALAHIVGGVWGAIVAFWPRRVKEGERSLMGRLADRWVEAPS